MSEPITLTAEQLVRIRALVPAERRLDFLSILPEPAADAVLRALVDQHARADPWLDELPPRQRRSTTTAR